MKRLWTVGATIEHTGDRQGWYSETTRTLAGRPRSETLIGEENIEFNVVASSVEEAMEKADAIYKNLYGFVGGFLCETPSQTE
jgi:hypothetical protein